MRRVAATLLVLAPVACGGGRTNDAPAPGGGAALEWAVAIHGGAGVIPRSEAPAGIEARRAGLRAALDAAAEALAGGAAAIDAVETAVRILEDDPHFNAGRGAVFTRAGTHELDAAIMDGQTLDCGAVTGVSTVKHPVTLARRVLERTDQLLLAGAGAERFADGDPGIERVDADYFSTEERYRQLQKALEQEAPQPGRGTVGAVARDRHGHLAAATSTGGLTGKLPGRVGDTPIIGAGTWADDDTCAISATGIGEEFIRHGVAHAVSFLMAEGGRSLEEAAHRVIQQTLRPGDGGIIAVDRQGRIVMEFNTGGMYRAAADATGRREIAIWE